MIITIEVFPSKIDYRSDYYKLLQDVNKEIYNLAYDFLRKTFQKTKLKEVSNNSMVEFFSIIRLIFNNLIKAFRRIEKYPHHRLSQTSQVLPAVRVKRINQRSIKWLRKNCQYYDQELELPIKMLNINKQISFDTFENRFVKWIISQLMSKLILFEQRYRILTYNPEEEIIQIINWMMNKLNFILKNSFLKGVGNLYKIDNLSLVLQMAPGYREIYKYYLMLLKGLSINGQIFKLSMKQIWELYEYWCFLELNHILREKYQLVKHNLFDVNYQGIFVKLNKGRGSRIKYKNPLTGETFTLSYNQREGEMVTTGQKPDNVLTLNKEGSTIKYKFVFDAKYRINPAYPNSDYYKTYNGIPGPDEELINAMHRYRDAIVVNNNKFPERVVVGAFVLFPYHDEEKFKEHRFYKSIKKVNIGAFPFLPGSTKLVTCFLENIIEESYFSNYERNILPVGTDDYRRDTNFEQNVLIGSLKNREQFEIIYDKNYYYLPYQKSIFNHDLKYVAIYQSKRVFGEDCGVKYYGRIKCVEIKKRKEIEVPTNKRLEMYYLVYYVDEWKELDKPIKPEGYGVIGSHIYTSILLLEKAKTIPELSIKTLEEWRTWLELKRIQPEVKILLTENKINSLTQLKGFEVKGMSIMIEDGQILIKRGNEINKFTLQEFLYNLRGIMNELYKNK